MNNLKSCINFHKTIILILFLVAICGSNFSVYSQSSTPNQNVNTRHTWSKQELLNAGFKFAPDWRIIPSNIIFGETNTDGKLNGLIVAGSQSEIFICYAVDGAVFAPLIEVLDSDKFKYTSITENTCSYAIDFGPMSYIAREIFGLDLWHDSADLRVRLCKGYYDYKKIAKCFDEFIESGKKIPENAWIGHEINIDGISLNNSNPFPSWLKSNRNKSLSFAGPYNIATWDRSARRDMNDNYLENDLPNDMDMKLFGVSFDYMPTSYNVTGGVMRINRAFEICVDNGEIVIRSEVFSKKQWYTGCKIKPNTWNNISLYYSDGSLIMLTNGCTKFAAFRIERPGSKWTLRIKSGDAYDQTIGKVRNVKVEYNP